MEIVRVAIVGAGTMGCGTALELASLGCSVLMKDIDPEAVALAPKKIRQEFRAAKLLGRAWGPVAVENILGRIQVQTSYAGFAGAQLVIENIVEDYEAKRVEYSTLIPECSSDAIFAINTSCISITRIAGMFPHPERVIGTHFMNPVPVKKLVEVVCGEQTSDETKSAVVILLEKMKKTPVVIKDAPGFVSNRISHIFMNEAALLVEQGLATPAQVDLIFKEGYGHRMGPLETADLIGLDTVVRSLDVLRESYQDNKFECAPLLRTMVASGCLGRKSGRGFFVY